MVAQSINVIFIISAHKVVEYLTAKHEEDQSPNYTIGFVMQSINSLHTHLLYLQ